MQDFEGKKIVLGVCGGIAAYKSAYLVRELVRLGAEVQVVMTEAAKAFISPMTFQALSGREVRMDLFDPQAERSMGHIELARWADYLIIAPATANFIAKMAQGLSDDLLSTLYLVALVPVLVCPAMNHSMWKHPATRENCQLLAQRGVVFVGPEEGEQACGEYGPGRVAEPETIISSLRMLKVRNCLSGQRVLITAGPTREALDPVRYISNESSGRMGYALAEAARMAGAEVVLVSGPTALPLPAHIECHRVTSAKEMFDKVMQHLEPGTLFIGCAAVADYSPVTVVAQKIKKLQQERPVIELKLNPDILSSVAQTGKAGLVMGFAAETDNLLENAKQKLKNKKLDLIVANQVGNGLGFDSLENEVVVLSKDKEIHLPLSNKQRLAADIVAILASTLQNVASSDISGD
ncbi:bifunctional phosphopantothenoylcysteine decarboxylase/phosphopantothenate--cysteine ligase CoaBC [Legionella birminghamensis]|nr:bifunctional phosphopantothenoylcysteine decarboxylase/phosphopantothenate--cysteine ligase CoaBC [Legionella birminghamensis]STX32933.1 bifunctional phosphopantothenoylcysteine decarboxylase/phosphopantothenate synthase [Legionella birminghamensis]